MKFPFSSVRASFATCFAPSRSNDTSAPASGFPLLSFTVPVMTPSDLAGAACVMPGIAMPDMPITNDTNASQDKLRVNGLLMCVFDLRDQSPSEATAGSTTAKHFLPRLHACQVIQRQIWAFFGVF